MSYEFYKYYLLINMKSHLLLIIPWLRDDDQHDRRLILMTMIIVL